MGGEEQKEARKTRKVEGERASAILFVDWIKHVSTLSTGSIVLMVALWERVLPQPEAKGYMLLAYVAFTMSILGAVFSMFVTAVMPSLDMEEGCWEAIFGAFVIGSLVPLMGLSMMAFIAGVVSLAAFAIENLDVLPFSIYFWPF